MSELTFLALVGPDYEVGLAAERVQRIVAELDWSGAAPIDVAALVPALAGRAAPRVLAVERNDGGVLALRTTAAIAVRTVEAAALLRLPRIVTRGARWIRGVVFAAEAAPLVVVDPEIISEELAGGEPAAGRYSLEELW